MTQLAFSTPLNRDHGRNGPESGRAGVYGLAGAGKRTGDVGEWQARAMEYSAGDAIPYLDRVPAGVLEMVRALLAPRWCHPARWCRKCTPRGHLHSWRRINGPPKLFVALRPTPLRTPERCSHRVFRLPNMNCRLVVWMRLNALVWKPIMVPMWRPPRTRRTRTTSRRRRHHAFSSKATRC